MQTDESVPVYPNGMQKLVRLARVAYVYCPAAANMPHKRHFLRNGYEIPDND